MSPVCHDRQGVAEDPVSACVPLPSMTLTDGLRPGYRVGMIIMANPGTRSRKPPKDEATRRLVLAVALASAVTVVGVIIAGVLPPSASKTTLDEP